MDCIVKHSLVLILFLSVLSGCSGRKNDNGVRNSGYETSSLYVSPKEVSVIELQRKEFSLQLMSNGQVRALHKSTLSFPIAGELISINCKNGDFIESGKTIASLACPDNDIALKSAEIALDRARIELYDFLLGQGYSPADTSSIPPDLMDAAKMRSGYSSALNNLEKAEYDVSCTVLKAPFSGRIADIKARKHDMVNPGPFCTILDDKIMEVEFPVMESECTFVSVGLPAVIEPWAYANSQFAASISAINPVVNSNGQLAVTAQLKNDGSLMDGMHVKVIIENHIKVQLVVPRSAVVVRDGFDVVFTYSEDGKSHWNYVKVLYSNAEELAIEADSSRGAVLNAGDKIIVRGNLNLSEGSDVVAR